jgi:hypothetical protein
MMKKWPFVIPLVAILGVILICVVITSIPTTNDNPVVHQGETWVFETGIRPSDSPFTGCEKVDGGYFANYYSVLEVKKGWVKYVDESGQTHCSTISYFTAGAHKTK